MINWVLVTWAKSLIAAFNTVYPGRPKASDGTIGDLAHQAQKSGHNPDDTPGVQAERTDADSTPEVRAVDITAFPQLWDVIQAILRSEVKDVLIYIIYRGVIWRKANRWIAEEYTGSDRHFGHAHFSGDPTHDNAEVAWESVLRLGDNTMIDMNQIVPEIGITVGQWMEDVWVWAATARGLSTGTDVTKPRSDDRFQQPTFQGAVIDALNAPTAPVDIDMEALAQLLAPEIATLLAPTIGQAVVEEVRQRLES